MMQTFLAWTADIAAGACGAFLLGLAFYGDGISGSQRAVCAIVGALIVWRNLFRPAA
jgi:hypothetical protein